eukprot:4089255-Amphidinium_carterae.1
MSIYPETRHMNQRHWTSLFAVASARTGCDTRWIIRSTRLNFKKLSSVSTWVLRLLAVPMVFESHSGAWLAVARRQVDHVNRQMATVVSDAPASYTAQRLSCALHRANARAVARR